jgi:hypothetical protein
MTITEGKGQEKGGIEGLKSPLGLRWGMDTTILALEAVIIAILLYSMHVLHQKLGAISDNMAQIGVFLGSLEIPTTQDISFDGIRDEITSIMQDMRPPQFMDHLGGAIASLIQAKAMGQMQQFQPDLLNQEQVDTD